MSDTDPPFGYDPDQFKTLLEQLDFSEVFAARGLDPEALAAMQAANLEALETTGRTAAASYQAEFRATLATFRAAISGAEETGASQSAIALTAADLKALGEEANVTWEQVIEAVAREMEKALAALKQAGD